VLQGHDPSKTEVKRLAASVLSQDEDRGQTEGEMPKPSTGTDFLTTLQEAIAPATIASMFHNSDGGIDFKLSDGRTFNAKRRKIKAAKTPEELSAYVQECIG
jgi:hypothetical protein